MHGPTSPAFSRNEHAGYTVGEQEIDGDARFRLDGPGSHLISDWRSADARAARLMVCTDLSCETLASHHFEFRNPAQSMLSLARRVLCRGLLNLRHSYATLVSVSRTRREGKYAVCPSHQCRYALHSLLHHPTKSCVETSIPRSLSALVLRWQSYGRWTLALGSLPSVFGTIRSIGVPMISPNSWHISYLVYLSSLENCSTRGSDALSSSPRYRTATSTPHHPRQ